jgi:hypothetical protein
VVLAVSDTRIRGSAAARLAHTVVETASSDLDELLRTWLEPFLRCCTRVVWSARVEE